MSSFRYSTEQFPLVIFSCPRELFADEVRDALRRYEREVLSQDRKFALIVDTTAVEVLPSALVRRTITEWMQPAEALGEKTIVSMAVATSSALIRGAMTAIQWVVPAKVPMTFEPTLAASATWSLSRLAENGVRVSPELERRVASFP